MKIFVTVGTTPFDSLIRYIDENFDKEQHDVILQIAHGTYIPKNFQFIRFTEDIDLYYKNSHVVIAHAGAGSVYRLLEIEKKMIIVPNMERIDKHQFEIAKFMHENEYAIMCNNFSELITVIKNIGGFQFRKFTKENFFAHSHIKEMVEQLYKA